MGTQSPGRRITAALLGVALAGSAAFAGDGPLDHALARILAEAGPPPAVHSVLAVDATGLQRPVVIGKCEFDGELELAALTRAAAVEEAFVFLPDHCLWIDVGVEQTATSVRTERALLDALADAYRRVILYHTHVDRGDPHALYLPAYQDMLAVILLNGRHLRHPEVEIRHRAVTPHEIFEYAFVPADAATGMVDAIFATGLGPFAGENLLLRYRDATREGEYYGAVRDCMARSEEVAWPEACFPMRAGDFVLERRAGAAESRLAPEM